MHRSATSLPPFSGRMNKRSAASGRRRSFCGPWEVRSVDRGRRRGREGSSRGKARAEWWRAASAGAIRRREGRRARAPAGSAKRRWREELRRQTSRPATMRAFSGTDQEPISRLCPCHAVRALFSPPLCSAVYHEEKHGLAKSGLRESGYRRMKMLDALAPGDGDRELALSLDPARIPAHIAIIMDGNGRWAKRRGLPRIAGHKVGVSVVRSVVEDCANLGVQALTLYAF